MLRLFRYWLRLRRRSRVFGLLMCARWRSQGPLCWLAPIGCRRLVRLWLVRLWLVRLRLARFRFVRFRFVRLWLVRLRLVWLRLIRLCLVRFRLARLRLVRFSLVRLRLIWLRLILRLWPIGGSSVLRWMRRVGRRLSSGAHWSNVGRSSWFRMHSGAVSECSRFRSGSDCRCAVVYRSPVVPGRCVQPVHVASEQRPERHASRVPPTLAEP